MHEVVVVAAEMVVVAMIVVVIVGAPHVPSARHRNPSEVQHCTSSVHWPPVEVHPVQNGSP
jgi:hypothetical protein